MQPCIISCLTPKETQSLGNTSRNQGTARYIAVEIAESERQAEHENADIEAELRQIEAESGALFDQFYDIDSDSSSGSYLGFVAF